MIMFKKITFDAFTRGQGCRLCGYESISKSKKYDINYVESEFKNRGYKLIDKVYVGCNIPMSFVCPDHPDEYNEISFRDLLIGRGCIFCSGRRLSNSEYIERFNKSKASQYVELIGRYKCYNKEVLFKCKDCGKEFYYLPNDILELRRAGCEDCINISNARKDTDWYINKLNEKNFNYIIPLEDYILSSVKIWHKCKICGYEWHQNPNVVLDSKGCPNCNNAIKKVCIGINDLWTTRPDLAKLLFDPEDGYRYTHSSESKVNWKCQECGNIIYNISISQVNNNGKIACRKCGDSISIPEKFMFNILKSINIEFETQKRFDWCKYSINNINTYGIYDFYFEINGIRYLVEVDGLQHDRNCSYGSLDIQKLRDNNKDILARQNGYKLIRIPCYNSKLDSLKQNILNSELASTVDLDYIDWELCYKKSLKSNIVLAYKMYNDGYNINYIATELKKHRSTIRGYLRKANDIGLCNYNNK